MFRGVMARDAGDTDRAVELLQKAHQTAPGEPNPALELAFTLERQHGRAAAEIYEEILSKDPSSRPALLGLARVARGQYRLDQARGIYVQLLNKKPRDPAALNGPRCVALAGQNPVGARLCCH